MVNRNSRICYHLHVLIRRLGFFDFKDDCRNPLTLLVDELTRKNKSELQGTLLVLPEALNLGRPYYGSTGVPSIPAGDVLKCLKIHAVECEMMFVASLLSEGYSEAYWVDPEHSPELMCQEAMPDDSQTYQCGRVDVGRNPIDRYGACVGALICRDSFVINSTPAACQRRQAVIEKILESEGHRIMCVPATASLDFILQMGGMWCVLASRGDQPSFVKDPQNTEISKPGLRGTVQIVDLRPARSV